MLVERQALKAELKHCRRQLEMLQEQHHVLSKQIEATPAATSARSRIARTTYQHIIGACLI
jgi:hypothetical protein